MLFEALGTQHLAGVHRCRVVQHGMADGDEHLVFASAKASGEGLVTGLGDDAFAHPIPELLLGNPVFLAVVADDEGGLFYVHKCVG